MTGRPSHANSTPTAAPYCRSFSRQGNACTIAALYPDETYFRSHIHMARHGFGKGGYRYFKYPLPDLLGSLRTALYPHLARVANE